MLVSGDALNCTQCFVNRTKMSHFSPVCTYRRCRNAKALYSDVEKFVAFWNLIRSAESVPREILIREANLGVGDLEILVALDSHAARLQADKLKQERIRSGLRAKNSS